MENTSFISLGDYTQKKLRIKYYCLQGPYSTYLQTGRKNIFNQNNKLESFFVKYSWMRHVQKIKYSKGVDESLRYLQTSKQARTHIVKVPKERVFLQKNGT